jgi:hypothetical protein
MNAEAAFITDQGARCRTQAEADIRNRQDPILRALTVAHWDAVEEMIAPLVADFNVQRAELVGAFEAELRAEFLSRP